MFLSWRSPQSSSFPRIVSVRGRRLSILGNLGIPAEAIIFMLVGLLIFHLAQYSAWCILLQPGALCPVARAWTAPMSYASIMLRRTILSLIWLFPLGPQCLVSEEGFPDTPECVQHREQAKDDFPLSLALFNSCMESSNDVKQCAPYLYLMLIGPACGEPAVKW